MWRVCACVHRKQLPPHTPARDTLVGDTHLSVKKREEQAMMAEDGPNNPGMDLQLEWLEQVDPLYISFGSFKVILCLGMDRLSG